ncbi:hypothetical protein T11_1780, partial [Trichinella zimbabwensis]
LKLIWEASLHYSELIENKSKCPHSWHYSEANLMTKIMNSIILHEIIVLREIEHIQGIRYDAQ